MILEISGERDRARANACSRPPDPTTITVCSSLEGVAVERIWDEAANSILANASNAAAERFDFSSGEVSAETMEEGVPPRNESVVESYTATTPEPERIAERTLFDSDPKLRYSVVDLGRQ